MAVSEFLVLVLVRLGPGLLVLESERTQTGPRDSIWQGTEKQEHAGIGPADWALALAPRDLRAAPQREAVH